MFYHSKYIYDCVLYDIFEYAPIKRFYAVIPYHIVRIFELHLCGFVHDNKFHFWSLAIHRSARTASAVLNVRIYRCAIAYAYRNWL